MNENTSIGGLDMSSKFWRVFLVVVAAFLIFAGPTYVSYVLSDILKVNYVASIVSGLVLFALGLVLMAFLIRKKIIV
ncbi:MAG: hypothetical protein NWE99_02435 [Candidatus Bathyarchaeota archaeon]|nr:hypothetical protein [Candidatus Bathyarchaeota archaeon]